MKSNKFTLAKFSNLVFAYFFSQNRKLFKVFCFLVFFSLRMIRRGFRLSSTGEKCRFRCEHDQTADKFYKY